MSAAVPVQFFVSSEEKADLEAQAAVEGISVSLLVYRRTFNLPNAQRRTGRPPKQPRSQNEGLFGLTG